MAHALTVPDAIGTRGVTGGSPPGMITERVEGPHNQMHPERTAMPRLTTPAKRISAAPARLPARREAQTRTQQRDAEQPWRRWYKTARWQKLRAKIIARDGLICAQTAVLLIGKHPAPDSPVVDHIRRHGGNEALFWDETNLQVVSKAYHDREKQRIERRFGHNGGPRW